MANTLMTSMSKRVMVLAFITCLQILSTEGRKSKSIVRKQEIVARKVMSSSLRQDNADVYEDGFRPTAPGHSPGGGHPKAAGYFVTGAAPEAFKPTTPSHSPGVGHSAAQHAGYDTENFVSVAGSTNDFRPTTPSHSPGIGHPKSSSSQQLVANASSNDIEHSVAGSTNDFRPTEPSHSPGVGHPKELNAKSNNIKHSVTGITKDFRPTAPGHSPGTGHPVQNKNAEPKA